MHYRQIGRTDMHVSSLSLGTSALGGIFADVDPAQGIRTVHEAVAQGVNFIDVAPYYGFTKAEAVLGRALRTLPRPQYLLSTKVGRYGHNGQKTWADQFTDGTLNSAYSYVNAYYSQTYRQITRCNNFLDNIDKVSMDATQKAIMVNEVRTIRAYDYFNLALYFGDVPLIEHVLTVEQANSVVRAPKATVWAFCETELKAAAAVLPPSVPDAQQGHMTAASALAILGRLQLAQQKWTDAAASYKAIMDFNYYSIDARYRELFLNAGELSREVIMSQQYVRDTYNHALLQYLTPETWGGWHQYSPFNELVKTYECTDGLTITQSPLYNPSNPYANRDPRLDFTIMISDRTVFRGRTYSATPGTTLPDRLNQYPGVWSGYCIYKFLEDNPAVATTSNDGNNMPLIRYAEVLLGYLEARLESGAGVDQALLDATINKVRAGQR